MDLYNEMSAESKEWIWNVWEVLRGKQDGRELEMKFLEKLELNNLLLNRVRRESTIMVCLCKRNG